MLANILGANLLVGLIGVVGAYSLIHFFIKNRSKVMILVSFAAGAMIAVSFFDLLPEAIAEHGNVMLIMEYLVIGFVAFLLIEKAFFYYHCHEENCERHASAKLVIIGDSIHNLLDGVAIAASFLVSPTLGIATTIAIIIHEIPQEFGDIGILVHAGYSKTKALFFNFISGLFAVLGGLVGFYYLNRFESFIPYVLALTAGGFIYIAAADLLPEVHAESNTRTKISIHSIAIILGIVVLWILGKVFAE
ncbi:MAG: zinc/iron permease [Parcubacteria group bacterium Gr01-1014_13]|nr:MAG: zinc/iron permease [Parcubacteria group bacterium Gr01-1014_13]